MFERRSLERITINQPALLHVDGIRGCHPCLVGNFHNDGAMLQSSTHHTAAFKFDCHWMASKRQSIVVWSGGTEIPAASNFSIKATLAQRTARSEGATAHSPKLADFTLLPISRCPQGFQAGAPALSSYVKYSSAQ
jgi:hypothetical protein